MMRIQPELCLCRGVCDLEAFVGCFYRYVHKSKRCSSVDSGELGPKTLVDSGVGHHCGFDIGIVDLALSKATPW
ncbi:unnamed protein product [Camellia sinensis]